MNRRNFLASAAASVFGLLLGKSITKSEPLVKSKRVFDNMAFDIGHVSYLRTNMRHYDCVFRHCTFTNTQLADLLNGMEIGFALITSSRFIGNVKAKPCNFLACKKSDRRVEFTDCFFRCFA